MMRIITPESSEYPQDKAILNARLSSNPAAILYCSNTQDVVAAVKLAQKDNKKIRIRSTGHSYEGFCTGDESVYMIDVSQLQGCELDPKTQIAQIGGGAQLYENVYLPLWDQGPVTIPGGSCPTVGIMGLLTGGGFSFSGRHYGLTCDSVLELEIVTADGQVRIINAEKEPDLFWACRGAGNGNFGVITRCAMQCYPAPDVSIYKLQWDLSQQGFYPALSSWFEFLATTPPELMPFFKMLKQEGTVQLTSFGQFYGPQDQLEQLVMGTLGKLPTLNVDFSTLSNIDAVRHWGGISEDSAPKLYQAHHSLTDDDSATYFKATSVMVVQQPNAGQMEAIEKIFKEQANDCFIVLDGHQGGVAGTKPADYNAYAHRQALTSAQIYASWTSSEGAEEEHNIQVVEDLYSILQSSGQGSYVNYCDVLLPNWGTAYYGDHFKKLQQIKAQYDPGNIFSYSQSIPLSE